MKKTIYYFFKKNIPFFVTGIISSLFSIAVVLFIIPFFFPQSIPLYPLGQRVQNTQGAPNEEEELQEISSALIPTLSVSDVVAKVNDSVVAIEVFREMPVFANEPLSSNDPFFGFFMPFFQRRQVGTELRKIGGGSGFFVSRDGLLVTNRHVVDAEGATFRVVLTSGRTVDATLVARDPVLDVALLRAEGGGYTPLSFGDSSSLQLGEQVIAIGFALAEFTNSVSTGVVSGLSRSVTAGDTRGRFETLDQLIQTDAAINPGNSGGPLLNLRGEVIGVNVAVAQGSQNIGFALPSNAVQQIVNSVRQTGEIIRPYLGIRYVQITQGLRVQESLPVSSGIIIRSGQSREPAVLPGSPAERAGLQEGDIILSMDGVELTQQNNFASLLRQKQIGQRVALRVLRNGQERTISVILERNP